jgi:hypothetical protein
MDEHLADIDCPSAIDIWPPVDGAVLEQADAAFL